LRRRQPAGLTVPYRRLHGLVAVHGRNLPHQIRNLKPSLLSAFHTTPQTVFS
jgi:hypothetical protein